MKLLRTMGLSTGLGVVVLVAAANAEAMPAGQARAAAERLDVRKVSAPPREALAGSAFRLSGSVRNNAKRSTRPQLFVSLRASRNGAGRQVASKRLSRIKPGRTLKYSVRVRLPRSLAGRFYVAVCVRAGRRSDCRLASRRITVLPTTPSPSPPGGPPAPPVAYDILAFTEGSTANDSVGDAVGALHSLGARNRFRVTVASSSAGVFTESNLKKYRAVLFLNTAGDVLDAAEQTAFENYFKDGGGFLGIHSAIATEPDWQFLTDLLGTRATGTAAAVDSATIKVADRVHDASKLLPEYWGHTDAYYNFAENVRGFSHVLATVDETTYSGGTMGADHPVAWCKDTEGGRSFYTALGRTKAAYADASFREHLMGAIAWTAGLSDPVYSDCGATVLANYEQTKVSAPPNLNEPIGFDQFPDGRIIQTTRDGRVRLHDPETGVSRVIATIPVYAHSEDGLYGPAVDNNFATNKWVYLYYSPLEMEAPYPRTTPAGAAPTTAASLSEWDAWKGYFQLSRFKFVEGSGSAQPTLNMASEQKILKVEVNRGACCHVAGDIDFDKHNNLWLVTGDDTPAGGGNSGGWGPFNDLKTDDSQTVRTLNATAGTFTLTFGGQTTAPIAWNATPAAIQAALEALSNIERGDVKVATQQGNGVQLATTNTSVNVGNQLVIFDGQYKTTDVPQMISDASGLTGTSPTAPVNTVQEGNLFQAPFVDARRSALNTNDLRGKVLRIKVNERTTSYTIPQGNLFPESEDVDGKTRPEIYAMGFRNPFRIQVDSSDVAYVTDYSPDARDPGLLRGPAGTGRVEIVRKPANYGWPVCMSPDLPMFRWDFNTSDTFGEPYECDNPTRGPQNLSRHNTGREYGPPITQPDIWYSYNDNASPPQGTPCFAYYDGSGGTCPQLFPELATGGVGPHGAAKYDYDPNNPSETKFPPYYDGSVFLGEFTRDYLREVRLDSQGKVFKINNLLNCGQALIPTAFAFECDNPMDMQFGADGAFYLLTYGDGFFSGNPDAGMYKFEYVAGPQKPKAEIGATPTNGQAPLTVQFSSEGSRDPDEGDSIRFEWDFDNDGTVDSVDPNPSHTYTANGVYIAKLTVTDASGKHDSKTTSITVGNTAPTVTITTPADGDFFEWGQNIPYTVTITDPEDGTINCADVAVTFVLLHDTHGHGEDSERACTGVLQTNAEDASHGGYIAGAISVSYTDKGANGQPALSTTTQHVIQQRRQQPEYSQDMRGLTFPAVGGAETDPGGGQVANAIDPGDYVGLNNRYFFGNMNQEITFRFAQNSTAGTTRGLAEVRLDSPTGPIAATCTLVSTGGGNTYTNQTCPFTTPVVGSHKLYIVFAQAPGGPTGGFGTLNWVQFSGAGHGVNP